MRASRLHHESDATLSASPRKSHLLDDMLQQPSEEQQQQQEDMEEQGILLWNRISRVEQFTTKYGRDLDNPGAVHCYMFTRKPRSHTFAFETFASVQKTNIMKEELVFHPMFERVIERYTKSNAKPNPVLMETRSTDFCYRLTILVEAVLQSSRKSQNSGLHLLREYAVLHHLWERHRDDLMSNLGSPDLMVGIPMPFEFVNVVGCPEYEFGDTHGMWHIDLHGEEVPLSKVLMPGSHMGVKSSLSYLSIEKLGPTLQYIVELLKSQRKLMSMSSALKIFDQLLCRLMVLHRYGVVVRTLDAKFISFGVREAANVLYIHRFDSAVVAPTKELFEGTYSDRCASTRALRRRKAHFVDDIESAFYIFLSLIFSALPWDEPAAAVHSSSTTTSERSPSSRKSSVIMDEKMNFWANMTSFNRMIMGHMRHEFSDPMYQGFTIDLMLMLYSKTQEVLLQCDSISQADFMSSVLTTSSLANNAFSGLRRIIAAYFRFERLASISNDLVCKKKVELLLRDDPKDRRTLWDLNDWCWNAFYPAYASNTKERSLSMLF